VTTQVTDSALFQGDRFLVCGANGTELVEPSQFGLKPAMPSTACYRGWMAEYLLIGQQLQLADLYVFHDAGLPINNRKPNGPVINGVSPQDPKTPLGFNCLYKGLDLPLLFTGGLLLGKDLIRDLLGNTGFHAFWKFEEVHELIFQQGQLTKAVDKSDIARTVRAQHLVKGFLGRPDLSREKEVAEWIEGSFSLRYEIQASS
jgi:hypothetical protein